MHKFVPIVMLTTESQNEKKMEGKTAGATGWIVKPFKQDQLLAVVKKGDRMIDAHKQAFKEEATELLSELELTLLSLEHNPDDGELIAKVFRGFAYHKGFCRYVRL